MQNNQKSSMAFAPSHCVNLHCCAALSEHRQHEAAKSFSLRLHAVLVKVLEVLLNTR